MSIDINTFDSNKIIFEKLQEGYGDLKEVPSKMPAMDRMGETKWYDPGENSRASFQGLRMQTIRDVEIRNFHDREQLDLSNSFITTLMPDDEHALPIFSVYWAESAKGSYFIADFYPTADCICDIPYMEHYLEPLEDAFSKGMEYFPSLGTGRNPNWFKALCSPYCISGDFFPSTKVTQRHILDIMNSYLNIYYDLWEKDQPRDPEYMKPLNTRKEAIKRNFREKDPGAFMMEKAVGEEMADLGLRVLF